MATPTKILVRDTTKMTLHERFSLYRQNNMLSANAATARQTMAIQRQASMKNQRLAVQMANRPSVMAALKLKKRSLKQRLGMNGNGGGFSRLQTNIKARLTLGNRSNIGNRIGYSGQNFRGGRGRFTRPNRGFRPGTSPMLRARLGLNQNQLNRAALLLGARHGQQFRQSQRGNFRRGRGFNRGGGGGGFRQQNVGALNSFRSNRNNRFNNRNRGRGRGRGNKNRNMPSKQDLDNDIDQYMAQTKNHLDAELDAYMAQAE